MAVLFVFANFVDRKTFLKSNEMKTTPCAAKRLEAVNLLDSNYFMVSTSAGNAVIISTVSEAVELADEYSLKVCLLEKKEDSYDKIRIDKKALNDLASQYDLKRFAVALSE